MRNKIKVVLPVLFTIPLLQNCASIPTGKPAWGVEPVFSTRHSTDNPDAFYQLGRYYQGQNRLAPAAEAFAKAVALAPTNADARNSLATVLAMQGNYRVAIKEFQTVVAAWPTRAEAHNNLGYAYYLNGQIDEAIAEFRNAVQLDPAHKRAQNNLGLAYAKAGRPADSNTDFAKAAEPAPAAAQSVSPGVGGAANNTLALPKDSGVISPAPAAIGAAQATVERAPMVTSLASVAEPAIIAPAPTKAQEAVAAPQAVTVTATLLEPISVLTAAESRMEVIPLSPNVYELRLHEVPAAVAVLPPANTPYRDSAEVTIKTFRLEVANGNGITGLASRVSRLLIAKGMPAAWLTNQKPFRQAYTEIHYRPGFFFHATRLGRNVKYATGMIEDSHLSAGTDVRLVLGKDHEQNLAILDALGKEILLAMN